MKILLIIAAAVVLFLLIPVKAHIVYDGELTVRASVCGVPFTLIPRRKRRIRLRDWTKEAVEKREAGNLRKAEKKKAAEEKKKARKAEKESRKKKQGAAESNTASESGKKSGSRRGSYMRFLRIGVRVLKKLLLKLRKNLRFDISRLWIKTAGGDADKVAQRYGIISGGVSHALAFLGEKGRVRYSAPKGYDAVYVEADFTAPRSALIVDVSVASSVGKLLGIVNGTIGSAIAGFFREFVMEKE